MRQRVLVTGAAGFVGSHLCRRLAREGFAVRALVRAGGTPLKYTDPSIQPISCDLRDSASFEHAVTGIDCIYHIGALFRSGNASRQALAAVNVQGTENLLVAAARAGVRKFIHCSTVGVYGDISDPPATEEFPYSPGDDYEVSKVEGELIVRRYMERGPFDVTIVQPSSIYGPGDLRFLKLVRAINSGRFVMLGSGEVPYQMIFIDDLIDGILLCGQSSNSAGRTYILSNESPVMLGQLVALMADRLGVARPRFHFPSAPVYLLSILCEYACKLLKIEPILHRRRVNIFRTQRCFSIARAQKELGFIPRTTLQDGLEKTIRWYRDHGYL